VRDGSRPQAANWLLKGQNHHCVPPEGRPRRKASKGLPVSKNGDCIAVQGGLFPAPVQQPGARCLSRSCGFVPSLEGPPPRALCRRWNPAARAARQWLTLKPCGEPWGHPGHRCREPSRPGRTDRAPGRNESRIRSSGCSREIRASGKKPSSSPDRGRGPPETGSRAAIM